jgi:tetratricopeptide (TPR) repeat protein
MMQEGKLQQAEIYVDQALEIDTKALRPNHPRVAGNLSTLAIIFLAKRDYEKAESLSRSALSIATKTLGPDHPFVASCMGTLAFVMIAKGNYQDADTQFQGALAIDSKALGASHPTTQKIRAALEQLRSEHATQRSPE